MPGLLVLFCFLGDLGLEELGSQLPERRAWGRGGRPPSLQLLTGWGSFVGLPGPRVWCPNRAGAVAGTRELLRAYFGGWQCGGFVFALCGVVGGKVKSLNPVRIFRLL